MRTGLHTLALGLVLVVALASGASSAGAATTPDDRERATLVAMREEEKLAHDVYVALAAKTGDRAFLRIAASEERHGRALERALAQRGIADPTDGYAAGRFPTASTQRLYDELVDRGAVSRTAAIGVGLEIERMDIADLKAAIVQTDEPVLDRVYANLLAGSQRHLKAFEGNLARDGAAIAKRAGAGGGAASWRQADDGGGRYGTGQHGTAVT